MISSDLAAGAFPCATPNFIWTSRLRALKSDSPIMTGSVRRNRGRHGEAWSTGRISGGRDYALRWDRPARQRLVGPWTMAVGEGEPKLGHVPAKRATSWSSPRRMVWPLTGHQQGARWSNVQNELVVQRLSALQNSLRPAVLARLHPLVPMKQAIRHPTLDAYPWKPRAR
jgi:hypothetical protein